MRLFQVTLILLALFSNNLAMANDVECGDGVRGNFNLNSNDINRTAVLQLKPDTCTIAGAQFVDSDISNFATSDAPVVGTSVRVGGNVEFLWIEEAGGNVSNVRINGVAVDPSPVRHTLAAGSSDITFDHKTSGSRSFSINTTNNLTDKEIAQAFTIVTQTKVTNVSPGSGPSAGGTKVTITGQSLTGVIGVTFNGVAATGVTFNSDTEIEAITPAGVAGAVDVRVTSNTGFNSANTLFSYDDADSGKVLSDTEKQIIEFMHGRAVNLLNTKPDLTGFLNGTNSADALLGLLDIDANSNGFNLSFSSSLGRIWSKQEANEILAYSANADHMSAGSKIGKPQAGSTDNKAQMHNKTFAYQSPNEANSIAQERGYDMWVQLHAAKSNAGTVKSDLWVGHAGTHAFLSSDLLIGVMGQLDWAEQSNSSTGSSVQGLGWMLGPYLATRLPEQNLYFDTRILWGQSNNTISPDGSYEDRFKTERWMANAKLSGVIAANGWTIQPAIEVNYFQETLSSYTDSNNTVVSKRSISMGEIRFGPSVSRQWTTNDGIVVRPSAGVTGVFNFAVENEGHSPASGLGSNDLRARFEAGLTIGRPDEWALNVSGFYDGVGTDNFESYGGSIRLVIPLP